jgi:hypothetical protein
LGEDLKDTCEAFTKAFSCLRVAVLICGPNWPVTDRNDLTGMTFLQGRTL